MPTRHTVTFFRDSHDNRARRTTVTWDSLAARLTRHDVGPKDGPAIACATFNGERRSANVVERTLVALDIETNTSTGEVPPYAGLMAMKLRRTLGVKSILWTTHSHLAEAPRYRIVLPLERPIPYDRATYPHITFAVACELDLQGVADRSKFGAASLFFLPRHIDGNEHMAEVCEGRTMFNPQLETAATMMAQDVAMEEAERAALRRPSQFPEHLSALIQNYNATHPLADALRRYGYMREGQRWKSPFQHGIAATVILNDGMTWVSFSASDAAAGIGAVPSRSSECSAWGDAFALFCHFEHGGSMSRALQALHQEERAAAQSQRGV